MTKGFFAFGKFDAEQIRSWAVLHWAPFALLVGSHDKVWLGEDKRARIGAAREISPIEIGRLLMLVGD